MFKMIAAFFALSLAACSAPASSSAHTLFIDSHMSPEGAQCVIDAAAEWETATGGKIAYTISMSDGIAKEGAPGDIAASEKTLGAPAADGEPGEVVAGETFDTAGLRGGSLFVDPASMKGPYASTICAHEFGHALGLVHELSQESIMAPDTDSANQAGHVTAFDAANVFSEGGKLAKN